MGKKHKVQASYTKEEQAEKLKLLEAISKVFYAQAARAEVHTFLEVNGFLAELIKMFKDMHEAGIDFATESLRAAPHQMAYVAEKIDCIFGDALSDPKNREAFLAKLEEKGGWKWEETKGARSEGYESMTAREQWAEDKRNGTLDD